MTDNSNMRILSSVYNYMISYMRKNNDFISDKFKEVKIKFYDQIPNSSAHANADIEKNEIKIRKDCLDIVTLLHEFKHLANARVDSNNKVYSIYEYEDDFNSLAAKDKDGKIIVTRGIKGRFLEEATAELFATNAYWYMNNYSKQSVDKTKSRYYYDYEVITLKKICCILGINENEIVNFNNHHFKRAGDYLTSLFKYLTNSENTWINLEKKLDKYEMKKVYESSSLRLTPQSLEDNINTICDIDIILNSMMDKEIQRNYYNKFDVTGNEFEQLYQKKVRDFKVLEVMSDKCNQYTKGKQKHLRLQRSRI